MNSEYKLTLEHKTVDNADQGASLQLSSAKQAMGFIPNMYSAMANSPALLDSYLHGYKLFREQSHFSAAEQEVIFLTISRENGCGYCIAAHSFVADNMSKVPTEVTDAIRNNSVVNDDKLSALVSFTSAMVKTRGLPTQQDVNLFLKAGFKEHHILEIILAISVKTISNYANHIFHTEVDNTFSVRTW